MQSGEAQSAREARLPPQQPPANTVLNEHRQAMQQNLQQSRVLINAEPKARDFLTKLGMQLKPLRDAKMCPGHRAELRPGSGIVFEQSIIRDRALMPMCQGCVNQRTEEIQRLAKSNRPLAGVDTCVCAAMILASGQCYWCTIETMNAVRNEYCVRNACDLNTIKDPHNQQMGLDLYCKCGGVAMFQETMRNCIVCDGLVSLPLHAIDRTTHLAVPIWKRSQYAGDFSHLSDPGTLMGWHSACTKHPVPVVAELLPRVSPAMQAPGDAQQQAAATFGQQWGASSANPQQPPPQQPLGTPQIQPHYANGWHPLFPPGVNNRQSVLQPPVMLPRNLATFMIAQQGVQQTRPRSHSMVPQPAFQSRSGNNVAMQQENGSSPHYQLSTRVAKDPSAMPDQVYRSADSPNGL